MPNTKQKFKHAAERPWSISGVVGQHGLHPSEKVVDILAADAKTGLAVLPLGRGRNDDYQKVYADAALIITAVNYHEALIDKLKNITDFYGVGSSPEKFCENVRDFMLEASTLIKRIEDGEYAYPE